MNHHRNMLRRISASLLCAVFLLGGSLPARAEQIPATPTDLEEKAQPFEQTETAEGVRITVTAEPGVFAADAVLSVVKADDAEAARAADVDENIMAFPDQYRTMLGERGVTVSGGQKQRIAIARALMRKAPVLILDDALSAVDTDTEERILTNLKAARKGKTTLIIAHRISTIQHADHILVLEDGRQAEYGTHQELLNLGGIYRTIFDKQQLEKQLQAEHPEDQTGGELA